MGIIKRCQHGMITGDPECANPATHLGVVVDPGGLTHCGPAKDGMAVLDLCCKHYMQTGHDECTEAHAA
jgi:hypothetical protein